VRWLDAFNVFILAYFVALNVSYLALTLVAFRDLRRYVRRLAALEIDELVATVDGLPISLVVPAYDEAATIVPVTRALLTLRYGDYEIVIVNDGSTDATLDVLIDEFGLVRGDRVAMSDVPTAPVRGVYRSRRHPKLVVVDKDNGGKADALNAGLNYARSAILCAMDADTILEPDALARVARPFLEDRTTVAVGGIVRIANGCRVQDGSVEDIRLPRNVLARFQVLEYLRAFLAARVGWNRLGATLIISGAFGAFRRSVVAAAGGFDTSTVGEDMELVVRLHRHCRDEGIPYRITFIPDPVAWTEAPETLRVLEGQRRRWQRGLGQVLVRHRDMVGRRRYGVVGWLGLPSYWIFELLGPVIELAGYVAFGVAAVLGVLSVVHAILFLALAIFLGSALSVASIALEEMSFRRYRRFTDLVDLLLIGLVENFGYRQLSAYWRLRGIVDAVRRRGSWGDMSRRGFSDSSAAAPPSSRSGRIRAA